MLKTLLIASSALALTAGVASAQSTQRTPAPSIASPTVSDVEVFTQRGNGTTVNAARAAQPEDDVNFGTNSPSDFASRYSPGRKDDRDTASLEASNIITQLFDAGAGTNGVPSRFQSSQEGNKALVDSDGTDNTAKVNQKDSTAGFAVVNQDGDDNDAELTQTNSTANDVAGSNNLAVIQQVSARGNSRDENQFAKITQLYDTRNGGTADNAALISQGGSVIGAVGLDNSAEINQAGNGNEALVQQGVEDAAGGTGRNGKALVQQTGSNNDAAVHQKDGAQSDIRQTGSGNRAYTIQVASSFASDIVSTIVQENGDNNFADVDQTGESAESRILQDGSDNEAWVEQTGSDTFSEIRQSNNGNYARVFQASANAQSTIVQQGNTGLNGNYAYVHQAGIGGLDTAGVFQNGLNNTADVNQ